ncbi:hypothetical protein [Streptomyces gilvosporeus]|uniref:hypothetical protein n=1 Tax=Streptomyces gilvosporeus TaxID=553510 RepID=UPI001939FBED|nr:hypothetical protein [Streptomyces gilvosporeus]
MSVRRWPLGLLCTVAVMVLLDTLVQAALAGLFVTGDSRVPARLSPAFATHSPGGTLPERAFNFRRTHGADERQLWTVNGRPFSVDAVLATRRLGHRGRPTLRSGRSPRMVHRV